MKQPKTYFESRTYYAVVYVKGGSYYIGNFKSRSAARRKAIQEQAKIDQAERQHMIYNARFLG